MSRHVVVAVVAALLMASTGAAVAAVTPKAPALARVSPAVASALVTLPGSTDVAIFGNFDGGNPQSWAAAGARHGLTMVKAYPLVDAAFYVGPLSGVAALRAEAGVVYIEDNRTLQYFGDTDGWATGARVLHEPVGGGPYLSSSGTPLDGTGVGVAVVDAGVDARNPDLTDRVAHNYKGVCTTPGLVSTTTETCYGNFVIDDLTGTSTGSSLQFVELPPGSSSDTSSGHGTHVAGIIAGTGVSSTGAYASGTAPAVPATYTGVAPGATLYAFGVGEAISIFMSTEAFDYILENYDSFSPRIRVINNSYGDPAGTAFDPQSVTAKLDAALVAKGAVVVYAAGNGDTTNNGGTGADDRTSSESKDPTPGVISVANYDDQQVGTRNGTIDPSSSRGLSSDAATWPDISAPGTLITSTAAYGTPLGTVDASNQWAPNYAVLSGTSMATPQVVGAVAVLLQAAPSLTPAQVEQTLQDSAHKFTYTTNPTDPAPYVSDPQNPSGTSSYDKGAGLLDIPAALRAVGVAGSSLSGGAPVTLAAADGGDTATVGAADLVGLTATEGTTGITFDIEVANATDAPASPANVSYRLYATIGDTAVQVNVINSAGAVSPSATDPVPAQQVQRVGNHISFLVPFAAVGDPPAGSIVHTLHLFSYAKVLQDTVPGLGPGLLTANTELQWARPFTLLRGTAAGPALKTHHKGPKAHAVSGLS